MRVADSTALVTGASSGIGEQIARQLAARGANLILVARSEDKLNALRDELLRSHAQLAITVVPGDLAEAGSARAIADEVSAAGLTVDLLVNNAGVGSHENFVDEDQAAITRQIQLNVGSLVELTGHFLPGMVQRDNGGVINVASTAAFQPIPTMAVYGATKAFVLSFTEALWGETRSSNVRVFALCPGATETAFFDNTGKRFLTGGRQRPEDVAACALGALEGRSPTVIPGLTNRLGAAGHRFLPRSLMIRVSKELVKESS